MNARDLFIQVHWGSWGKSPSYRAQPPSLRPCPRVMYAHNQGDWVINDQARGAIDNLWWLYTKAITFVTLAPVWEHLAGRCGSETQGVGSVFCVHACLPPDQDWLQCFFFSLHFLQPLELLVGLSRAHSRISLSSAYIFCLLVISLTQCFHKCINIFYVSCVSG